MKQIGTGQHEALAASTAHRKKRQHQTVSIRPHLISAAELFDDWGPLQEGPVSLCETSGDELLRMAVRYLGVEEGAGYMKNAENTEDNFAATLTPETWFSVDYAKAIP